MYPDKENSHGEERACWQEVEKGWKALFEADRIEGHGYERIQEGRQKVMAFSIRSRNAAPSVKKTESVARKVKKGAQSVKISAPKGLKSSMKQIGKKGL